MMSLTVLVVVAGLAGAASSTDAAFGASHWAGHQVTIGSRWVPFKGRLRTRVDSFVLARATWDDGQLVLTQRACRVQVAPVAGVHVRMAAEHLPRTRVVLTPRQGGAVFDVRSKVAWGSEDIDGDGNPGMTVSVDARICDGQLYVANTSSTSGRASFGSSGLAGDVRVHVEQRVLGAQGACLSVVARDTDERQHGPFAYVPVAADSTCEQLLARRWPVDALAGH